MKKFKTMLALLCAVTIILSSTVTSFAITTTTTITKTDVTSKNHEFLETSSAHEAVDKISQAVLNYETSVDISEFSIDANDFLYIFEEVLYSNPKFFYLNKAASYSYNQATNKVVEVMLDYFIDREETQAIQSEIDKVANEFLSVANTLNSDLDKALYANEFIVLNTIYDVGAYNNTAVDNSYTMVGALLDGLAVCQGYMLAYNYLLNLVGIETDYASSNTLNHTWNMVKIDNKWYYVDVTWNDPVPDKLGRVSHKFFMMSEDKLAQSHDGHIPRQTANDTTYDNYYWTDVDSAILPHDQNLYYFTTDKKLIKKDINGNTQEIPYTKDIWKVSGSSSSYYPGNFARIAIDGDKIYYNTSTAIYSMNVDGSDNKVIYTPNDLGNNYIYGLAITDGFLYYEKTTTPVAEGVIVKTELLKPEDPIMIGDVDGNGIVGTQDVLILQKYIANLLLLTDKQFKAGDTNSDGIITTKDLMTIQRIIANIVVM